MAFWNRRAPDSGESKGPALHRITPQSDKNKVPQTLLLADDSVTIQRVIELTFADEDIKVVAVSDGDQAIDRIESEPPDIVLVDVGMPGRSGYEVAHHIKQSPRLQHIPVLLLTGAFEPVDQAKATAAGCNGVLAKPFEPQLVIARVKELLGIEGRGAPAAEAAAERPVPKAPVSDVWAAAPAPGPESAEPGPDLRAPASDGPLAVAGPARPPQVAHLDQYFADLDAAFATLDSAPGDKAKTDPMPAPVADDWFHMTPDTPPAAPPSVAEPARQAETPQSEPAFQAKAASQGEAVPQIEFTHEWEAALQSEFPRSELPSLTSFVPRRMASLDIQAEPGALPPLADAFAAILAAEQHEPTPALGHLWPTSPTPAAAPAPSANGGPPLGEEAIEQITRRVLDRLSDQIVRETVADLVSHIAERLAREEIERIKSAIK